MLFYSVEPHFISNYSADMLHRVTNKPQRLENCVFIHSFIHSFVEEFHMPKISLFDGHFGMRRVPDPPFVVYTSTIKQDTPKIYLARCAAGLIINNVMM